MIGEESNSATATSSSDVFVNMYANLHAEPDPLAEGRATTSNKDYTSSPFSSENLLAQYEDDCLTLSEPNSNHEKDVINDLLKKE